MTKISRNDSCPCGSGKKFKKCCLGKELEDQLQLKTYHDYCLELVDSLRPKILQFMKKFGHDKLIEPAFKEYWRSQSPAFTRRNLARLHIWNFLNGLFTIILL